MSLPLLIGSNNAHKARELSAMLESSVPGAFAVYSPADRGITQEPEENGKTFEDNALIKARYYCEESGLMCLADDSGLSVDALDGRPGVYSSRYAPSDPERIERLLAEMCRVKEPERTARFVCAAALVLPGGGEWVERGTCEGRIAFAPSGHNGFGYDPVFLLPERGMTMAELLAEEKNAISHRGRALQKIVEHLAKLAK